MDDAILEFDCVWKKFRKGERHDSLRDLIPNFGKSLMKSQWQNGLRDQEFWALTDVSFQVGRGDALGIIGSNGAGKSTALKLLSRIIRPDKGSIKVNGKVSALIEVGAGFHQDLTGRENIYLNGAILGMRKDEVRKKFDQIVDFSGLKDFIDTPVKRYSSGMYARLGFSVAVHIEPDILIVDEVLSVGDWAFQRKCIEKMITVLKSGVTVIFVSHNLRAVASLCDKALLLEHGRVIHAGPTNEVIKQHIEQSSNSDSRPTGRNVFVSSVVLRDDKGVNSEFAPGERMWIDISVSASVESHRLAVGIHFFDENYYQVFNTSSERLGYGTFTLNAGETQQLTYELYAHFGRGAFYLGVMVKRYDIDEVYDERFPVATVFLHSDRDVRGAVNLYPQVVRNERVVQQLTTTKVEVSDVICPVPGNVTS